MIPRISLFFAATFACAGLAFAKFNYPPELEGATEMVYKETGDTQLKLWVFSPKKTEASKARPGIVFFFGGGWKAGSPEQFAKQSEYLAKRGMVAIVADYRVASRHGTKAKDCVADARDAVRYVRKNAAKLGIDPNRLAAGGGSAGGHIAACLGLVDTDEASKPDAMALFNPAVALAPIDGKSPWPTDRHEELKERMGMEPEALSPIHHISKAAPPCVIFHGTADDAVPYPTVQWFAEKMKAAGVSCTLHSYEGEPHGFFNFGRNSASGGEPAYAQTLRQLDAFFVDLGWLES